jgi:enoyl-CoA hydratase/carnithine racemase
VNEQDVDWKIVGRVATVTLDRAPVNALRTQSYVELEQALIAIAADLKVSVAVLRSSSDRIFSAGADVKELPMPPDADEARQRLSRRVFERVLRFPVPVICAVPGPALGGGCALAAVCDIRLATTTATFGLPEINVGRAGGGRFLMRLLPQGVVRHAYFTGRAIGADDAFRLGLVSALYPDAGALDEAAQALADELAAKSPTAIRLAKQSLDLAEELPVEKGYEAEQQFSLRLAGTPDAVEAARAFREKRPPNWGEGT